MASCSTSADMTSSFLLVIVCLVVSLLCFVDSETAQSDGEGTKCYKNKDLGEYDANIYYCPDPNKPECCEQNQAFTCCDKKTEYTLKNQLILWGAVFGVVGAVAIVWICYRKDTYMCEGETLGQRLNRCCGCEKKVMPDDAVTLSDLSAADDDKRSAEEGGAVSKMTSHSQYYENDDDMLALTSRQVAAQVEKPTDADSGRGSTMSIETVGNTVGQGSRPPAVTAGGQGQQATDAEKVKTRKSRKKAKNRKINTPHEIFEVEEFS